MMEKLQEMKQQMDQTKQKLETITVKGEAGDGAVVVTVSGNRELKSLSISEELQKGDKEELEDTILVAMNRAMKQAEDVNESEVQGQAQNMMPFLSQFGL